MLALSGHTPSLYICIEVLNFRDNNDTGVLEILNSSYLDFDDPISKIEMNIQYKDLNTKMI